MGRLSHLLDSNILAECHAELGTFAEGQALGEEGLRIAEMVAHPTSLMWAHYGLGLLALCQGGLCRVLPRLEEAMGICRDVDLPLFFPMMASALGTAYAQGGRVADGVSLLTLAMEQTMTMALGHFQARCRLSLGEAHLLAGSLEEAQALTERALTLACEHQERGHQAYALRLLGDLAARRQPPESVSAVTHYQQALALAEELGMRPLQAHCHRGLGTLYATIGQQEQACAELSAAIELYQAMDMTFWLPQTESSAGAGGIGRGREETLREGAMGRVILGGKEVIMSMQKEEVLELVRQLLDEVDVEEVIYRLYLREKLAAAEADIAAGRTLSPEEVREQART